MGENIAIQLLHGLNEVEFYFTALYNFELFQRLSMKLKQNLFHSMQSSLFPYVELEARMVEY